MADIQVIKATHDEIKELRVLFLQENNFQFVHNKCHQYGWADVYSFHVNGKKAGYGSVWGQSRREDRDTIFEFYLLPPFRSLAALIFSQLIAQSGVAYIECQSNDLLSATLFFQFVQNIQAEAILFKDSFESKLNKPGIIFRKKTDDDQLDEDTGDYLLLHNDEVVADGGLMLNYNLPFADIYMKVKEGCRQNGFGSLIVQELKKEAYRIGRVPAARCNINNHVSKATLMKAGLEVCGFLLTGEIKKIKCV